MTLQASMMHQDVSDLDFDTYFNVASNVIPQTVHNQPHSSVIYSGEAYGETVQRQMPQRNQLNMSFNSPLPTPNHNENSHQGYFMAGNTNSFQAVNWRLKQQQHQQQQHLQYQQQHKQQQVYTQPQTPVTTPGEPYNSVTTLNQSSPRPDYFYEATHRSSASSAQSDNSPRFHSSFNETQQAMGPIKSDTPVHRSYSFDYAYPSQQLSSFNQVGFNFPESSCSQPASTSELSGLQTPISDIVFSGTSQNQSSTYQSDSNSQTSPSPKNSPSINEMPFKGVFETIGQWGKSDIEKDQHDTRHWRQCKKSDSNSNNASSMITATVAAVNVRSSRQSPMKAGRQLKKVAHNAIERRYRNNINDRIRDLKNVVPALYRAKLREKKDSKEGDDTEDDLEDDGKIIDNQEPKEVIEGVEVAKKLNKATILHKATEYIHHLKYTSELAERENQLLQQILAQMPSGAKVLARFHKQKEEFQKNEQQRQIQERKEAMELEKAERQRILRERAAQRAALAELLPKPSRRPYRRRAKKQVADTSNTTTTSSSSLTGPSSNNGNKTTSTENDQISPEKNNDTSTSNIG